MLINGDALYYKNTKEDDGTLDRITTNDYNAANDVVIGDPNPDFIYGFDNTLTYKDLILMFYYRAFMVTRFSMAAVNLFQPAEVMVLII